MRYRLLIIAATIIWGSSFVIVKDVTTTIAPAWLLALRFTTAAVILLAVFAKGHRKLYLEKSHVLCGACLGIALFCAYYLQTVGIVYTTPGKNAFLTGTYCVIVPFLAWLVARQRPNRFNVIAAFMCIAGVGLISLNGDFGIGLGDSLTLGGAVFYAIHIVLVSKFSKGRDIMVLTMWQFAFVALCSWVTGVVAEPPLAIEQLGAQTWIQVAYLAVMCTAVALLFQNIGQAHLPPSSASLLLSLESVFGVLFSVMAGTEVLTLQIVSGFVLVFAAIVVSEVLPTRFMSPKRQDG